MTDALDPLAASRHIESTYLRYLQSLLPVRHPQIARALNDQVVHGELLTKGPILEANPPYAKGATLADLVADKTLAAEMSRLSSPVLPFDRPLYLHQEQAIRKAAMGRNLVVATGTGSGKTESFLLPILNALFAEHRARTLGPGVRALLLYPMNALANDQLKRLRQLLGAAPSITFGRYTGDTQESAKAALDDFELLNPDMPRLSNELLSREEMRQNPPHLLLTNYAMLEYLLLRPADMDLFDGPHGTHWQFIALDEAHVYDGAKASEVAMLLRRFRDRVRTPRLQCLATSATIGDDPHEAVGFAQKLFDMPFEWVPGDVNRQDLVTATRNPVPAAPMWGPLEPSAYAALAQEADPSPAVLKLAAEAGYDVQDAADALAHEHRMAELRRRLLDGPKGFGELAAAVGRDAATPQSTLADLVQVGARVHDEFGSAVLSSRFHLFARATEGAFTCLTSSGPHVSLGRREACADCGGAVFEFAACKRCGGVHLLGTAKQSEAGFVFSPRVQAEDRRTWLLLADGADLCDEDDEVLEGKAGSPKHQEIWLCPVCGGIYSQQRASCGVPGCGADDLLKARRLNSTATELSGCLQCGARGANMVRQFESGTDAAAAVLATALYQELPAEVGDEQPSASRKLLSFSDSRQAAAFFAPYLESTYHTLQRRRILAAALADHDREDDATVEDWIYEAARAADRAGLFARRDSTQTKNRQVAAWVMAELVATDDRQSLEGLGMLRVECRPDPKWPLPRALVTLGFSQDEGWQFLSELVRSLRQQGAVTMPKDVDAKDEIFDPRRGPIYVRKEGSESGRKVLSWLPTSGDNKRLDYVRRVLAEMGSDADAVRVLDGCWSAVTAHQDGWLRSATVARVGAVRQLDYTWLTLTAASSHNHVFRCDLCRRVAAISVRGVCPTMGCQGVLEKFSPPSMSQEDNHFRVLYQQMNPVPLSASEHTAQWTRQAASDVQQRFLRGEINVLSCSTTFELGVDVGELQSVLLRNVPPTNANYIQRAGRAGRRTDSAALVVTYALRRSHDLTRFAKPETMVAGKVRTPLVPLDNDRIDRRHLHSIALAAYFRFAKDVTGEVWKTAGDFFLPAEDRVPGVVGVAQFLNPVPAAVRASARAVLSERMCAELGVADDAWVTSLLNRLEDTRAELDNDMKQFELRRDRSAQAHRYSDAHRYQKTMNTLSQRNLIGFLANHNVLPKYGFPVDTVDLRTTYSSNATGDRLELSRDLSSAIYEYAPGAQIVAGGVRWTSGGIYRLPDKELYGESYRVCQLCLHFRSGAESVDPQCPSCHGIDPLARREYRVPEFGFVAARETQQAGMAPPKRSWNGATYVLSMGDSTLSRLWRCGSGAEIAATAGARSSLIAVSEGSHGTGYLVCDRCGYGTQATRKPPRKHPHLLRDSECEGLLRRFALAHPYQTDLCRLDFPASYRSQGLDVWHSVLYGLLEGAVDALQLSRDDIDGTLHGGPGGRISLVLFDTVPGGAGASVSIACHLNQVIEAAFERVSVCECGPETSCYGCLRGFRNQKWHDVLQRGLATDLLSPFRGALPT